MPPSWAFLILILLGGALAVTGTTLYPVARSKETANATARSARFVLLKETERNISNAASMLDLLEKNQTTPTNLDVSAWETISKGGLISTLRPDEISNIINVYNTVYRINSLNTRLVDTLTGVAVALDIVQNIRTNLIDNLKGNLKDLQTPIASLKENLSKP